MFDFLKRHPDFLKLISPPATPQPTLAAPQDEPIYTLPPMEREPEVTLAAHMLAESRDWSHENLRIADLHAKGYLGAGATVAILDTGIDVRHPDLEPAMEGLHRDFTGSPAGHMDRQGHGTHCAGIVGARSNGDGTIGIAPKCKIFAVKVLNDQGSGASSWIAAGIRYAASVGADVISMSLGGPGQDPATRSAIQEVTQRGVLVICAAGNDGGPSWDYPGAYPESLSVAATDRNNQRASFSTINSQVDVGAPGVSILSTLPNGRYGTMSGTSMACPCVAGVAALVVGAAKAAGKKPPTQSEFLAALARTSNDIAPPGKDDRTGTGLIDPAKLIEDLVGKPVSPPPQPDPNPPAPPVPGKFFKTIVVSSDSPVKVEVR